MVTLRKLALVIGTTVAVGLSACAQDASTGSTSTGSTGSTGGSTSTSSTLGDASLSTPPKISALSSTSSNSSSLNSSNAFSFYYANPYYQGKAGSTTTTAPGGFGAALYGTSGSTTSNAFSANSTGRTGSTTGSTTGRTTGNTTTMGAGNTTTGLNANRGQTGFGNTGSNTSGIVVQLPRQIAYTSTLNFQAPVVTMPQMQQNLRVSLDRSTMLTNPRGIELTMDGNVVVLKGNVATEDEQRLVEGMIRLTPGVRDVRNELKVPGPTPAP